MLTGYVYRTWPLLERSDWEGQGSEQKMQLFTVSKETVGVWIGDNLEVQLGKC